MELKILAAFTAAVMFGLSQADNQVLLFDSCFTYTDQPLPGKKYSQWSEWDYYPNLEGSWSGDPPSQDDRASETNFDGEFPLPVGTTNSVTFPTGVKFTYFMNFNPDNTGVPPGTYCGFGNNGFTNFNCYVDNLRQVYKTPEYFCQSYMYCLSDS